MAALWDSVTQLYAYMAVVPIVPFALVYIGYAAFAKDKKRALRMAMDVTTALLIGSVTVLFNLIFGSSFGFYGILLILLLGAGLLGNLQYRKRGSVNLGRIVRAVWRLGFFVMGAFYLLFLAIAVGQTIWQA
ncbi:hypothetical protein BG53_13960 [Paenibacillus darwinianus]|uniref:DUF3397 domain-containing protein n=1 Tax=Paenibacillus darwinianus TaxID=1380763 RepID=A0A9W5S437_9BACL|nr:DUF3397 domain-containing protein [Paenibacillus darwinianus]EXX91851.1 hypothetical protein BG52_06760 [Paenibacillus darwinianus]EXX92485.1 hypothetical protein BG53_13960 [Paenibacillus darwinianus]EXX92708.1 hypothetical protein CH50_02605 [Paenibacillus darwinianus]